MCDACGDPLARQPLFQPSTSPSLCSACGKHRPTVTRARAVGEYDGALRAIVHALKYGGRRSLARPLAALMRDRGADLLSEADCVVPVPLHWRREYSRGFNQARELCRHLGLPVAEALIRSRHTRAQVELAADRRHFNVAGVFRTRRRWFGSSRIEGMKVLLVDDVSTTGATLDSCAGTLKAAGAADVFALTAARVVTRGRHAG